MATINAVNATLLGQTGTGTFVGSISPTIVTPRIGQISDTNGNLSWLLTPTASAVNGFTLTNAATLGSPSIFASGTDTNINAIYGAKGSGAVFLYGALGGTDSVVILNGTTYQHATFLRFSNTAANRVVTFPDADGTIALITDGTFTPVLAFGGASVGITYSNQTGYYSITGNTLTFKMQILLTNKGSSVGSATITGLPVASRVGSSFSCFSVVPGFTYVGTPVVYMGAGSATMGLQAYTAAGAAADITNTSMTNTSLVIISGSYLIN